MFAIFESVLSKPHEAKSLREKLLGKKKNGKFGNVFSKAHETQALREKSWRRRRRGSMMGTRIIAALTISTFYQYHEQ